MSLKRGIVTLGKETKKFFSEDLQNIYYKYYFLREGRNYIKGKIKKHDTRFIIDCKKYWKKHTGLKINTMWHEFYSQCNSIVDVRYIPENIYYSYIEPFYNRKSFIQCCDDKCYYSERFPETAASSGVQRPKTILRNINGLFFDEKFNILKIEDATTLLTGIDCGYVIKESITGTGGNRLIFVDRGIKKSSGDIRNIFKKYSRDFVVEALIDQCQELSALNPTSINTIRFITFMNEKGVYILSSVMRIGGSGSRTDNFSTGGMACGIDNEGILKPVGYDQAYNKFEKIHPNGRQFADVKVPKFDEASKLVKELHRRFGHFRIISWDVAIGDNYKPILIEFNLTPQSIDFHQINNGPLFGNLTEAILHEVFEKKK